jgi:hypothetical protein
MVIYSLQIFLRIRLIFEVIFAQRFGEKSCSAQNCSLSCLVVLWVSPLSLSDLAEIFTIDSYGYSTEVVLSVSIFLFLLSSYKVVKTINWHLFHRSLEYFCHKTSRFFKILENICEILYKVFTKKSVEPDRMKLEGIVMWSDEVLWKSRVFFKTLRTLVKIFPWTQVPSFSMVYLW